MCLYIYVKRKNLLLFGYMKIIHCYQLKYFVKEKLFIHCLMLFDLNLAFRINKIMEKLKKFYKKMEN